MIVEWASEFSGVFVRRKRFVRRGLGGVVVKRKCCDSVGSERYSILVYIYIKIILIISPWSYGLVSDYYTFDCYCANQRNRWYDSRLGKPEHSLREAPRSNRGKTHDLFFWYSEAFHFLNTA